MGPRNHQRWSTPDQVLADQLRKGDKGNLAGPEEALHLGIAPGNGVPDHDPIGLPIEHLTFLEALEKINACVHEDVRHGRINARIGTGHLMAQFCKKDGGVPHRRSTHPNKEYPHREEFAQKETFWKTKSLFQAGKIAFVST